MNKHVEKLCPQFLKLFKLKIFLLETFALFLKRSSQPAVFKSNDNLPCYIDPDILEKLRDTVNKGLAFWNNRFRGEIERMCVREMKLL